MYDGGTMTRTTLGVLVGALIIGTLCGCRAMSKHETPGAPPPPPPVAGESKPTPAPPPTPSSAPSPPAAQPEPIEDKGVFGAQVLREALGEAILPLIDGELLVLQNTLKKGANDPNITLEGGKLTFKQTLLDENGGNGAVEAIGAYQKLGTTSGAAAVYANPTTIDFNFEGLQVKTGCLGTITLTGKVHCSIKATYTYGANTLSGAGQCMTHTNGILDNLRIGIGTTTHKARYVLGFKVQGNPKDLKAYQWMGMAYVGGIAVDITQLDNPTNVCNK